jgi:hypothetical protein
MLDATFPQVLAGRFSGQLKGILMLLVLQNKQHAIATPYQTTHTQTTWPCHVANQHTHVYTHAHTQHNHSAPHQSTHTHTHTHTPRSRRSTPINIHVHTYTHTTQPFSVTPVKTRTHTQYIQDKLRFVSLCKSDKIHIILFNLIYNA